MLTLMPFSTLLPTLSRASLQRVTSIGLLLVSSVGCVAKDDATSVSGGGSGGTATTPLSLTFADGSNVNLGSIVTGSTHTVFLSVRARGSGNATVTGSSHSSSAFTFGGGSFPGTGGTCGNTISANCSIAVTFTPPGVGIYSDTVVVEYSTAEGTGSLSIGLSATAFPPSVLTVSDGATYNFGAVTIGNSAEKTFTITNTGGIRVSAMSAVAFTAPFSFKGGAYPGTGGTCGTSLSASGTCTVIVIYTPSATGPSTGNLTLNYHNGASSTTVSRALTGSGTDSGILDISDGATYDYGDVVIITTGKQMTFTVTNNGQNTATGITGAGLSSPFIFTGGAYPGTGGTCGGSLIAGSSCTIVASFIPTVAGVATDTIELNYTNGTATETATRPLLGNGVNPALLEISEASTFDYGSHTVGTTVDQIFTVTYSGGAPATAVAETGLAAPFAFTGGSFPGTGGTCGTTISTNCTIVVTFSPVTSGLRTDSIQLDYHNGKNATNALRAVKGTGLSAATLTISDANTYDFGTVTAGETVEHTFSVTYSGQSAATAVNPGVLVAPYSFKGGAYPGTGGTCGTTISTNCSIVVEFKPTSAGTFNATLSLDYSDGSAPQNAPRPITGIAASPAFLTISEAPDYDYGIKAVNTVTTHSFTVTNTGETAAGSIVPSNLPSPFRYAGGAFPGTGGNCSGSLAASGSCTVVIEFSPLVVGSYSGTFTLAYHDGVNTKSVSRPITGTGGNVANLSISDGPTYSFGTVAITYSAEATLTVTNVGGSQATSISGIALAAPYSFKDGSYPGTGGTCGSTLVNGANCTLVLTYAPTSAGSSSASLTLSYDNGNAVVNSSRGLSGVGATLIAITTGAQHTCVLYSTGIVRCWGSDSKGQLGNDAALAARPSPATVATLTNVIGISAGDEHTCATLANGRISCWGSDARGQLGNDDSFIDSALPATVANTTDFVQVAAGGALTCGRRSNGIVLCWGDDSTGGNGNGSPYGDNATPVSVSGLSATSDIAVGEGHACGLETDEDMECWGNDAKGQVGNNNTLAHQSSSVPVSGVNNGARIWAGGRVSMVRLTNGTMRIWGDNNSGQLGTGSNSYEAVPVSLTAMNNALEMSAGKDHTCGITSAKALRCWGSDDSGQLGDDVGLANRNTPTTVSGLGTVNSVSAGGRHTCAIDTTGRVYCWGDNTSGQLGTGSSGSYSATPVLAVGL